MRMFLTHNNGLFRDERGFSFAELLISIGILAVVTTAIIGLINVNTVTSARAENKSLITDAMAKLADELRAMPFEEAGRTKTYTANNGDIVMNVNTAISKEDGANVKVLTITGRSTRLDPNNTESISVILKSSGHIDDDAVAIASRPSIEKMVVRDHLYLSPRPQGQALQGLIQIEAEIKTTDPNATLTSVSIAIGDEVVHVNSAPPNVYNLSVIVNTFELNPDGSLKFPEGVADITISARDSLNGYRQLTQSYVIDNISVTNIVPRQTIAVTTVGKITAAWDTIPDPEGGKPAHRYLARLRVYDKKGVFIGEENKTISPESPGLAADTHVTFETFYSKHNQYRLYVYPMCPPGCLGHVPISTGFLYRAF